VRECETVENTDYNPRHSSKFLGNVIEKQLLGSARVITVRLKLIVRNQTSGEVLGDCVERAASSAERRQGLLSRSSLKLGEGLWIDPCEGVHSAGMKFAIDVVHIDRSKKVTKVFSAMKPWRISISLFGRSVLELPVGTVARTGTRKGDLLSFTKASVLLAAFALVWGGCATHKPIALQVPASPFERQIRNAVDAGDGDYQLARLREKVISNPSDLTFRLDLGAAYEVKGYPELALDHYRFAATQNPDAAEPQLRLVRALAAVHHEHPAIGAYAEFLSHHQNAAPLYWAWLGILQDEAGDWKAGEQSHRKAVERALADGQDRDYLHNNLGYAMQAQGQIAEAQTEFREALRLNPLSEIARDNLASTLVTNPAEALIHFQSVGEPAAAYNNLAVLLMEQGKYAEARQQVERSLSYNRSYPAALRNLKALSGLDGKPAIISVSPACVSRLGRVKLAVQRFFVGTPEGLQNAAPATRDTIQTASRSMECSQ